MANNFYLGQTPEFFLNQTARYFYGMTRTTDGFLKVTKVNLDSDTDPINLENLTTLNSNGFYDNFEEGIDFFEGVNGTTRMPNYAGLNFEQYKWSADDLYYYVDADGVLSVRVDIPYNYAFGVIAQVAPQTLLTGSTSQANLITHILANSYDFGTIIGTGNPMENVNASNLSTISDDEGALYAIDMGTITGS
jgi:hypothetical protein